MSILKVPGLLLGADADRLTNSQSWVATEGQTVFTLSSGNYSQGKKQLEVYIQGVRQITGTNFTETSSTSFTVAEPLIAGTFVEAQWTEGILPATAGHNLTHRLGGQDELDLKDMKGYDVITNKFDVIGTYLSSWKTPANTWDAALTSAINYLRTKDIDARGGRILIPSGTFDLSPFTLPTRISIEGAGIGISVLKMKAGSTGNFITVNSQSLFSSIKNLTIDGNKDNCPGGLSNLYFQTYSYSTTPHDWKIVLDKTKESADTYTYNVFENIMSANAKVHGLEIYSPFWGTTFKNIFTYACDQHGIYNSTTDIFFDTIQTERSGLCGIYENGSNNRWSNVKTIWNGANDTVNSAGMKVLGKRNLINNFESQDNYCDGLTFYRTNTNQAYGVLVDGNGRVPNVADSTTGQMVGNLNACGVRITSCDNIKIKGIASNYKAPACYLQNKAYIIEDDVSESYNIDIDLYEKYQYAGSQSLIVSKDDYYSDLLWVKGTAPVIDTSGLTISSTNSYFFDKYAFKEQGMVEMIFNVSSTNNSYAKFLAEKTVSPYKQFYIQRNINSIDFSMAYIKTDGTIDVAVVNVDLGTFPLNTDIYLCGTWRRRVSDPSKATMTLNIKVNGVTYTNIRNNISSLRSFVTPKEFLGTNNQGNDWWTGKLKFLQITDHLPNPETLLTTYSLVKKSYRNGVYYDFQNYNPKATAQIVDYTDFTGFTSLPPASSLYRNKTISLQGSVAATEVASLTTTAGCTTNGNVTITLDGASTTVALTTSDNTATLVATKIRAASFTGWTTGGSGTTVTFTANASGAKTDATYSAGSTGATGTMSTTTQGVTSTADAIYTCMKLANDTYDWVQVR